MLRSAFRIHHSAMMFVSNRYLPLIGVNLFTTLFDGLLHQLQVIRRDHTSEA